ncbi:hypothetical protein GH714_002957 [Hevea brasiliensis]|uniref:Fe2OG dioxygenase domain-containing protein n=1 Tax=Hevea brasiliensis TaxID=3981 RepID=A0A6A6LGT3_HEVBR|nr:hypothetical protein GH714_002957 [Hevea brasiliensis]
MLSVKGLVESGTLKDVPSKYAYGRNPEEHISLDEERIPIIDFSLLTRGTPNQRFKVIRDISNACQEWGFFMVINHGVPKKLRDEMINSIESFFDLAEEEKQEYAGKNSLDLISWLIAYASEVLEEYSKRTREVANELLKGVSRSLGLEENNITKRMEVEVGSQMLVTNLYSPCPQPEIAIGLPHHSDYGLLTLIIQNHLGGLQVMHNGSWVPINPLPDSILINIGDHMEDKTSIIKATLSTKRISKIKIAVLRATTHDASTPPSDKCIAAVSLGQGSRPVTCTCIEVLMDRLHSTKNASVALKCLFIMHTIISRGSFILKDQLSVYPSFGGRNFLNLSMFRDESDPERWDLSSWVRWHAGRGKESLALLNRDLFDEMDVLVDFVEVVSEFPDSLHLLKNNLIYEIVRLVSEDYRSVQREISIRVMELGERIPSLSYIELTQLLGNLKRSEGCKERLCLLFANRNRNDALWKLVGETRTKAVEMMKEKGEMKLLKMGSDSSELTQIRFNSDGRWMGFDSVALTVSAMQ